MSIDFSLVLFILEPSSLWMSLSRLELRVGYGIYYSVPGQSIFLSLIYSKRSLLRPPNIKTTSLLRPVFPNPKWDFSYDFRFDIKTISLI